MSVLDILETINIPSVDDGTQFVDRSRIDAIRSTLAGSRYRELKADGISYVYAHRDFDPHIPTTLISCHADSVYHEYFCTQSADELLGTLDNSICCAILIDLMMRNLLPPNIITAFTGNEERDLRGADETAEFLTGPMGLDEYLDMVIVLDVTAEGYGTHGFTVENLFIREEGIGLVFDDLQDMEAWIRSRLGNEPLIIPDAVADESWEYDEWDLNCFSLCIPTSPLEPSEDVGAWMHSDAGIRVKTESIPAFAAALLALCDTRDCR